MARSKKKSAPELTRESVPYWVAEISAARKRDRDFRKDGTRVIEIYEGKRKDQVPFNILFSNVETLMPALYSAVPRPAVERRYKDDDPLGKTASSAAERGLTFLLDTNIEGYETYDESMRCAVLDALLPGRGITCVKYDAEIGELPTESIDDEVPAGEDEQGETKQSEVAEGEAKEAPEPDIYKKSESVCLDARTWNRVFFGYAKKWSNVPWIAYEEHVDYQEACRLFGDELASQLQYSEDVDDDTDESGQKKSRNEDPKGQRKTACIYQIWDKEGGRKIRYVSEQYVDGFLKLEEDPLGITGFFNCPRPLQFIEKSNDLQPVAPYCLYEKQAEELNEITRRITRIVKAIKAKGIYDGALGDDIKHLVEADDNELVPADKAASIAAEKGIGNAIWFMPVQELVTVLQELYNSREACKQVIYEINGIADIMRGVSQASETLGAQQIKQSWGTLRLKRQQKEVMRYSRDLLRIMLEIAANKFSEETWARMTGLPYLTTEQHAQAQQLAQAIQAQIAAFQQTNPMPPAPAPGQPQQPPQAPPQLQQLQQQMQQVQAEIQKPVWGQVLQLLRDDMQRAYRIDIETNSTLDPEAQEDQKNIADVMNAMSQFMTSASPLVQQGIMPFQVAQAMLLTIIRRYQFGRDIEDYIKQMKPPQQGGQQNAEQQKAQAEMAQAQKEGDLRVQEQTAKLQVTQQQAQNDAIRLQQEAEFMREEHALRMQELAAKRQLAEVIAASKLRVAMATAAMKESQAGSAPIVGAD